MIAATVLSSSGYLVADALCSPRAFYAMAARRQLPRRLASLHPRFGTPAVAVCVYALLCALLTLSGSFRALALFSASTTLTIYLVSCLALLRLRARQVAQAGAPFRAPGGVALPIAAALLVGLLLASLPREELLAALLPVSVATVAYVLQARSQRPHGPSSPV
jgi:amino acid transporter